MRRRLSKLYSSVAKYETDDASTLGGASRVVGHLQVASSLEEPPDAEMTRLDAASTAPLPASQHNYDVD